MSLNWQWTDKMGEVIFQDYDPEHPFKTSIYQGNALMIWVNEFPNDTYSVGSFFCDQEHLRNMLGLNAKKGYGSENLEGEDHPPEHPVQIRPEDPVGSCQSEDQCLHRALRGARAVPVRGGLA